MSHWIRLGILVLTVSATGALLAGGGESGGERRLPAVSHPAWQSECSACHLAYHPALLPARSWQRLMGGLERHFGENASLDPALAQAITRFLVAHAAETSDNRRARRIAGSIPAGEAPLRVSDTAYFRHEHDEIPPRIWRRPAIGSRSNCAACHTTAPQGDFSERNVRIPR